MEDKCNKTSYFLNVNKQRFINLPTVPGSPKGIRRYSWQFTWASIPYKFIQTNTSLFACLQACVTSISMLQWWIICSQVCKGDLDKHHDFMEVHLGHRQVKLSPQVGIFFHSVDMPQLEHSCSVCRRPLDLRKVIWSSGLVLQSTGPRLCKAIFVAEKFLL